MRRVWLSFLLAGIVGAPGLAETRDVAVSGFDRIDLSGVATVEVRTGGGFAVHVDGDPDAVDALLIAKRGTTLAIGHKPGVHQVRGRVTVIVSVPRLVAATASGAGSIAVDRVAGPDFTAELSGVGAIRLPSVAVERLAITVSGAGSATVAGRAERIDLGLSGTGGIDAQGLIAGGGRLATSGVGSIHARVDGPVDVSASGVGSITVAGRPRCTVHRSGLGSVRCG